MVGEIEVGMKHRCWIFIVNAVDDLERLGIALLLIESVLSDK